MDGCVGQGRNVLADQMFSQCGFNVDRIASRNPVKHVIILIPSHLLTVLTRHWIAQLDGTGEGGRTRSCAFLMITKSALGGNPNFP